MLKNWENNGTEEIAFVTPTPDLELINPNGLFASIAAFRFLWCAYLTQKVAGPDQSFEKFKSMA